MLKDLLDGGSLILLCKAMSSYGYLRYGPVENPMFLVQHMAETKQFTVEEISSMVLTKTKEIVEGIS